MRELVVRPFTDNVTYKEISFDSSETLPTAGIADGSIAVASDTGDVYFYNETDSEWKKQFSFQD